MSTLKETSYYIALDIGTNSVGWAVTDTELNLIKAKKRNFWGVRKFDAGNTAENRRLYRSSRRRLDRRKQRINLIQDFFQQEINKLDPIFFEKMDNSWISPIDDYREKPGDFIFGKNQKKEKSDYYKKFPTIWHLRKHLVNTSDKVDIRLIYLAIHHIIKYRGNFLYTDSEFENTGAAIEEQLSLFVEFLEENHQIGIDTDGFIDVVKSTLLDFTKTTAEKKDLLNKSFSIYKPIKREITQFINAILGYKANYDVLFQFNQKVSGYIKDGFEDEKFDSLKTHLGTNEVLLDVLTQIYSWSVLKKLLPGEDNKFISFEMVNQYEEYGKDLEELKGLFSEYAPENKNKFFKSPLEKKNYYNYNLSKKDVSIEELYKTIDKLLPKSETIKRDHRYLRYKKREEDLSYLKVQNTTDKGAIPHQLHHIELEKILNHQGEYYPFLKINKEKIKAILSFRIPYYVGPLNSQSEFAWVSRREGKIYPWNFDEIVDKESSEEGFIKRMIGNCTYLNEEKVLPLESLIYQEYVLLNELNTIRVNGHRLDVNQKQDVIAQLFKKNNSVSIKNFQQWLTIYLGENQGYEVLGLSDKDKFNASLSSWVKFTKLGFDLTTPKDYKMAEEIIEWASVFSDKQTLRNRIYREYPQLTKENVIKLSQLNFKGWGRLSSKLLTQLKFTLPNDTETTILERMRTTNDNFMQIINNKEEGFFQQLESEMVLNNETNDVLEHITDIPGSPAIKKGINQAILLVNEIEKIMGKAPEKIFLEFAREDQEKKVTNTRYKKLKDVYDQIKKENMEFINKEANTEFLGLSKNDASLQDERIFLYFIQQGKCLYSGRKLDYNRLNSSDYEVDHIIPRSYTKDNSMSNKALVFRTENQRKKDDLLLEKKIIKKQQSYWYFLRKKGFISEKKYKNLMRDHISLNAMKGFINRQLVETRQISKHVKNILINLYPETKIQTIKAQFATDYRRNNDLYKLRTLNDFHHAHDAYLAMFLGEFIDRRLPWLNNYNPNEYTKYNKAVRTLYNDRKTFNKQNKYGILELIYKDSIKANWKAAEQNGKVVEYFNYKDCFITHKREENTGEFYKQLAIKADENKKKYPIEEGMDPTIYGGYTGQNSAYFVLVKQRERIISVSVPIQVSSKIKTGDITIEEYLDESGIVGDLIRKKILTNASVLYNGHPFIMKSSSQRGNGKQLLLPRELHKLIYSAEKNFDYAEKKMDFENYLNVLLRKLHTEFKELGNSKGFILILENNYEALVSMQLNQIDHFINESIKYFQVNTQEPAFKINTIKDLKNKDRFGRMGNKISNWKDIIIIDRSITGYYESKVRL